MTTGARADAGAAPASTDDRLDGRPGQDGLPAPAFLAIALSLVATAILPRDAAWLAALGFVIVLGVPHGALDGEVARGLLHRRFGRLWFLLFALPYLSLSALVLVAWHVMPLATLAAFLGVSVWHFGAEDAGPGHPLEGFVRGGLPIAVPTLAHPAAVAHVLEVAAGTALARLPPWLTLGAWLWLGAAIVWCVMAGATKRRTALIEAAGLLVGFLVLPPLTAFALYFVCVHAPRHMLAVVRDPARAPRVTDGRSAILRSLPIFGLTLILGLLLWPHYAGAPSERLLALTLQGLAALTLPHILLDLASSP